MKWKEATNFPRLEKRMGYRFHDRGLLTQAVTHSSYANENRLGREGSNERLEFLGDAVLETITSEFLFTLYPELSEGDLTKRRASMVCESSLALFAKNFGLPEFMLLGKGEDAAGGRERDSIISDAVEALIGAIYLDGGFEKAKEFVLDVVFKDSEHAKLFSDSKTILQEIVQSKATSADYRIIEENGPDHSKVFVVGVYIEDELMGTGKGHTKKAAEQQAAFQALKVLEH